jgi:hypothetical protein
VLEDLMWRFLTLLLATLFGLLVGLILTPFLRWARKQKRKV